MAQSAQTSTARAWQLVLERIDPGLQLIGLILQHEPLGVALSHGCVRMNNAQLVWLFERVPAHCRVLIDEAACPQWAGRWLMADEDMK